MKYFPDKIKAIKLSINPDATKKFRKLARSAFPKETIAYLLGHDYGNRMEVSELWIPPPGMVRAANNYVEVDDHIDIEANEEAKELGLQLLGDIHTHPWTRAQVKTNNRVIFSSIDLHPSATDWNYRYGFRWLTGICLIVEGPSGRLTTRFRYWGPLTPVEVVE